MLKVGDDSEVRMRRKRDVFSSREKVRSLLVEIRLN